MFIINRCFKNIWLESQMIHVALFSFQRTTLSFEVLASSDSFIIPHLFQTVKNFLFFFLSESSAPARRFQSRSIFLPGRCLAATCIILQDAQAFVNRYLELFQKKVACGLRCAEIHHDTKKASLSRCSSPYGRGSWTRTNACGIQRPVPYQLGDTPVSSASRCQQKSL